MHLLQNTPRSQLICTTTHGSMPAVGVVATHGYTPVAQPIAVREQAPAPAPARMLPAQNSNFVSTTLCSMYETLDCHASCSGCCEQHTRIWCTLNWVR